MGAIIDQEQHQKDVANLATLAELCPSYKRHLSHHIRNPFSALICDIDTLSERLADGEVEAAKGILHRMRLATEHILNDLYEVGL